MTPLRSAQFRKFAVLLTRFGLASTYLSGVADRFGVWARFGGVAGAAPGDMQHVAARIHGAAPVVPAALALVFAWIATTLDAAFGLGLLLGIRTRTMAFGSGVLALVYAFATLLLPSGLHATFASGFFAIAGASMLLAVLADDT
jgi:hypothetical protein